MFVWKTLGFDNVCSMPTVGYRSPFLLTLPHNTSMERVDEIKVNFLYIKENRFY